MRGEDRTSGALFCYVDVEARIGANHPLRAMRRLTNAALAGLDPRFSALYEGIGRPSIAPERLLRASLLQLLYSIRSERQLVERLEFDMLFRWFVGLTIDEKVFDASTFSKNRDRLLTHAIAQEFLSSLLGLPEVKGLLSGEHFSVDGTLLKAWASMKSFRPKSASGEGAGNGPGEPPPPGRNREADFRKTKRSNATHASTTDEDARLYRKGAGQENFFQQPVREDSWIIVAARSEDETEIQAGQDRRKTRSGTFGARRVDTFQLRRRSASCWKGCAARRASPNPVAARASPRRCPMAGQRVPGSRQEAACRRHGARCDLGRGEGSPPGGAGAERGRG